MLLIGDSHAAHIYLALQNILKDQNINIMQATSGNCFPVQNFNGEQHCKDMMKYMYDDFILKNSTQIDGVILSCSWLQHINGTEDSKWTELVNTINYYKNKKIRILIIGQNETYKIPYPTLAAKEYQYGIDIHENYRVALSSTVNTFLKEHLKPYYIDIYNTDAVPQLSASGDPYMFDETHFTYYGADITANRIMANPITKKFITEINN